jgi:hypothetical protein
MEINRSFAVGVVLALTGVALIAHSRSPRAYVAAPVAAPVATPAATPADPGIDFHAVKPGQKCVPYASNGTYLPELCGDHDAFQGRIDRALASD